MADTTSSSTYTAVDLSRLPAPEVVETLNYEAVYAQIAAGVQTRLAALNPPIAFDPTNETDPAVAVLQEAAYHVTILRARVNDAAKACMVGIEGLDDLIDHLGRDLPAVADGVTFDEGAEDRTRARRSRRGSSATHGTAPISCAAWRTV